MKDNGLGEEGDAEKASKTDKKDGKVGWGGRKVRGVDEEDVPVRCQLSFC